MTEINDQGYSESWTPNNNDEQPRQLDGTVTGFKCRENALDLAQAAKPRRLLTDVEANRLERALLAGGPCMPGEIDRIREWVCEQRTGALLAQLVIDGRLHARWDQDAGDVMLGLPETDS